MKRMVLAILLLALIVAVGCGWAEEVASPKMPQQSQGAALRPELNILDIVGGATVEQRAGMSRLLANKYPALSKDLFTLLLEKYPQVLAEVTAYVDHLVRTKYPEIPGLVLGELQAAPAVQTAIEKLISEKYPNLIVELAEVADSDDLQASVAQVIQQQHPELVADVLAVIRVKFPSLLTRLQYQVLSNHPGILIYVADMIQRRYPGFTNDVLVLILTEYPDLVFEVIATLNEMPAADAAVVIEAGSVDSQETTGQLPDESPKAEESEPVAGSAAGNVTDNE